MWREEIYERAADFKTRVAQARFRSAEWRFLAALDGTRTAGEIADELQLDLAIAARFVESLEAAGTIVPSLLSFEQFERVAGPLPGETPAPKAVQSPPPPPPAQPASESRSVTPLEPPPMPPSPPSPKSAPQAQADGTSALASERGIAIKPLGAPARNAEGPAPLSLVRSNGTAEPASAPDAETVPEAEAGPRGAAVDTSVGAAFDTLRRMRARARAEQAAAKAATAQIEAEAAQTAAAAPEPVDPNRAIVHQSAVVVPLAKVVEHVSPQPAQPEPATDDKDAEAAAWLAVLEKTRGS